MNCKEKSCGKEILLLITIQEMENPGKYQREGKEGLRFNCIVGINIYFA